MVRNLTSFKILITEKQTNMWLKKLFGIKTVSTKQVKKEEIKNEVSIQFGPEKTPTKNKWLNPEDSFGKLKRGTQ